MAPLPRAYHSGRRSCLRYSRRSWYARLENAEIARIFLDWIPLMNMGAVSDGIHLAAMTTMRLKTKNGNWFWIWSGWFLQMMFLQGSIQQLAIKPYQTDYHHKWCFSTKFDSTWIVETIFGFISLTMRPLLLQ